MTTGNENARKRLSFSITQGEMMGAAPLRIEGPALESDGYSCASGASAIYRGANQAPAHPNDSKYPLLTEFLTLSGQVLKPTYTNSDIALLFGVTVRAIQDRVSSGKLTSRDLPGRARFFASDIEEFLQNSRRERHE